MTPHSRPHRARTRSKPNRNRQLFFQQLEDRRMLATLGVDVRLFADNGGVPGAELPGNSVEINDTFFVEIRAQDVRATTPAGIDAIGLDIDWDAGVFEYIDVPFDARTVVTNALENGPPQLGGTLNNNSGFIDELRGFSSTNVIGQNALEEFALFRLEAIGAANNSPLVITVGSTGVGFADADPLTGTDIDPQTITVTSVLSPTVSVSDAMSGLSTR